MGGLSAGRDPDRSKREAPNIEHIISSEVGLYEEVLMSEEILFLGLQFIFDPPEGCRRGPGSVNYEVASPDHDARVRWNDDAEDQGKIHFADY